MQFLENEISTYVSMIWETMLGRPTHRLEDDTCPIPRFARASTQIIGQWRGVVLLDFSMPVANKICQTFFDTDRNTPRQQQLMDSLSEMANLMGGNIKGLLPQPSQLMLPIVSLEGDSLLFPGVRTVSKVGFECEGDPFRVLVMEQAESRFARKLNVH